MIYFEFNPELFKNHCPVYSKFSSILLELLQANIQTPEAFYLIVSCASTALIRTALQNMTLLETEEFKNRYLISECHSIVTPAAIESLPMYQNLNNIQKGENE